MYGRIILILAAIAAVAFFLAYAIGKYNPEAPARYIVPIVFVIASWLLMWVYRAVFYAKKPTYKEDSSVNKYE